MANLPVGFQVALELSNILPVRQGLSQAAEAFMSLVRSLRLSGSDLLVEEDLTSYFGRVWIQDTISSKFKRDILGKTSIVVLPNNTIIELERGSGVTTDRAFSEDANSGNLATVIQLSLLAWTHDRASLASAISYAMNTRLHMRLGATIPSPGSVGIVQTLAACSSQTSSFLWNSYFSSVRDALRNIAIVPRASTAIPANVLLACVDSFSIIQRFSEDHILVIDGPAGCVTIVIWAHHLLGLWVCLKNSTTHQEVNFPTNASSGPQIIIEVSKGSSAKREVCLLRRDNEVFLQINLNEAYLMPTESRERLPLRGYCAASIRRAFDETPSWLENQAYLDIKTTVVAMALSLSRRLIRSTVGDLTFTIHKWQIWDSAIILLDDEKLDYPAIEKLADSFHFIEALNKMEFNLLPTCLQDYLKSKGIIRRKNSNFIGFGMDTSAVDILVMATISGIQSCAEVPLICNDDMDTSSAFVDRLMKSKNNIVIESGDFFGHVCLRLLGPDPVKSSEALEQNNPKIFAVSEFGWTLFLPTFGAGDGDPAQLDQSRLFLKHGVPVEKASRERKTRIQEALAPAVEVVLETDAAFKSLIINNTEKSFIPRCVSPVLERSEFYGAQDSSFHHLLRFKGIHSEPRKDNGRQPTFEMQVSFRAFHDNLWSIYRAPKCDHGANDGDAPSPIHINVDVATAVGNWSWGWKTKESAAISERIVLILVKRDPRSRWLAVSVAIQESRSRRTMLRGYDCCESCAIQAAAAETGKWFIIL